MNVLVFVRASECLTELFRRGEVDGPLWSALLQFVVQNAELFLGDPHKSYQPNAMILLKVLEKVFGTFIVVKCLQAWFVRDDKDGGSSDEEKQALVDFSKSVDLKELSTAQLSMLFKTKSCALFPCEQILEAVFDSVQDQETLLSSATGRPTSKRLYVSGAGNENINGFYAERILFCRRAAKVASPFFFKTLFYEQGQDFQFAIHYDSTLEKWFMSIGHAGKRMKLDHNGHVKKECIKEHLYEADHDESVPFSGWKCCKGTDGPVPIVVPIDA